MSWFLRGSHRLETVRELVLWFVRPNSVKCGLFHFCVLTKHVCLHDPAINIDPAVNVKFLAILVRI